MEHIDIVDLKHDKKYLNETVTAYGWVRTSRNSKNTAFIELNDGSSLSHIQIVIDKNNISDIGNFLSVGSALKITGKLVVAQNDKDSVEINAEKIELLGKAPEDYPLQKKRHTLEFLRTIPHLRLRANTFNAVFKVRSVLSFAIHKFFQDRGFAYIHTPILTANDCEGAGEVFRVTMHEANVKFDSEEEYYKNDFFGKRAGLSVSGQLEGETAALGLGKIYTFGPSFRAEDSNTTRHVAEFWHVEPEVAFADLNDIMKIAEEMIKYIISYVLENCKEEMQFFDKRIEKGLIQKLEAAVNSDFEVVDYSKAIDLLINSGKKFDFPVEWGLDLQTEHERYITEEIFNKPCFIVNYPKDIKAFYMKQNPDGKTVAATDLLMPGVGEIIGCSERETDYDKLVSAMKQRDMNLDEYKDYLDLRKYGSVTHSGYGLGLERMIMYITGISNIRDVILYPRTVGNIR
ncbi:MAG: asparagine--tRNA ligase [Clostridia bacterium]|nr:asparagine--tRNA ligase [Clostridia bacterium]